MVGVELGLATGRVFGTWGLSLAPARGDPHPIVIGQQTQWEANQTLTPTLKTLFCHTSLLCTQRLNSSVKRRGRGGAVAVVVKCRFQLMKKNINFGRDGLPMELHPDPPVLWETLIQQFKPPPNCAWILYSVQGILQLSSEALDSCLWQFVKIFYSRHSQQQQQQQQVFTKQHQQGQASPLQASCFWHEAQY